VYADWLEERGDPRGELIRLEMEMARLSPSSDQYADLKPRRNELRRQVDPSWLQDMGYVPTYRPLFRRLPASRTGRWRLVDEFIEYWHRPLHAGDGFSEAEIDAAEMHLGHRLPAALREWYTLTGNRGDLWSVQDRLLPPFGLKWDRDILVIRYENQGCEKWGIRRKDLHRDDPPVFQVYDACKVSPTTTAFAIFVMLYEVKFRGGVVRAWGGVRESIVADSVERKLGRCKLPERYWVANPHRFYEGTDLLVETTAEDDWVYATARTEEAFQRLGQELCSRLERN
jgi:hypothetical protein